MTKPLRTERVIEILKGEHDPFESEIRRMCREILQLRGVNELEQALGRPLETDRAIESTPAHTSSHVLKGGES